MSEKRFTFDREVEFEIFDNVTKKSYDGTVGCQEEICQLLNEQQATINHLEKVNGKNFAKRRLLEQDNLVLRNENEQLRQLVEEYRKTNKHLSELCADASKNGYLPPLEDLR